MLQISSMDSDSRQLLDPLGAVWKSVPGLDRPLIGTPTGTQPTPYTRVAFKGHKVGAIDRVKIRALHDASSVFFHLEWADSSESTGSGEDDFPDAAAVVFPVKPLAPIDTMGSKSQPVNAWQWRADREEGRSVVAHGIGTTEPTDDQIQVKGVYDGGGWHVVLSRTFASIDPGKTSASFKIGMASRFGVAVWEGHNRERGGLKAYTKDWIDFEIGNAG